jgi:hypothetical protein
MPSVATVSDEKSYATVVWGAVAALLALSTSLALGVSRHGARQSQLF